jgi:hypothetical protein
MRSGNREPIAVLFVRTGNIWRSQAAALARGIDPSGQRGRIAGGNPRYPESFSVTAPFGKEK